MGFTLAALFFCWLAFREYKKYSPELDEFSKRYIIVTLCIAAAMAYRPVKFWCIERKLSKLSTRMADGKPAKVHCNSVFDSIFTSAYGAAGLAFSKTGQIVYEAGWCQRLLDYLNDPEDNDPMNIFSLTVFTHESMHIRGELDEKRTECQSIQRLYRAAKMFGVPEKIARKNSVFYYENLYPKHQYYSDECKPGSAWDENLYDSTWKWLQKKGSDE